MQSLLFQQTQQQQEETHVPPRSQDDIPKKSGPEMGVAGSAEREVCGEQEFLPPLFSSSTLSS